MLKDKISPLDKEKLSKRFTKKLDSNENKIILFLDALDAMHY